MQTERLGTPRTGLRCGPIENAPHAGALAPRNAHDRAGLVPRWGESLRGWLSRETLQVLGHRAAKPGPLQGLWRARHQQYTEHVQGLRTQELVAWGARRAADNVLSVRRHLTAKMFPIVAMKFHHMMGLHARFDDEPMSHTAGGPLSLTALGCITPDHVLLDGLLVQPHAEAAPEHARPAIVFAPPNGMIYEELLTFAGRFALDLNCSVLLFNHRGIGKSIGRLESVGQAVTDAATFLAHARTLSAEVGVVGISMGGGTGAAALAHGAQRPIPEPHPSLFVAIHTFTSWREVLAARRGTIYAGAFFTLARLLGIKDLQTDQAMRKGPLAHTMLIAEASHEPLIAPSARLGSAPGITRFGAAVYFEAGRTHGDVSFWQPADGHHGVHPIQARLVDWRRSLVPRMGPFAA